MSDVADPYTVSNLRHPGPAAVVPIGRVDPTAGALVNPNSPEVLGGIATITFSFAPSTAVINWTDANGSQSGNLATFNSTADFATVTVLNFDGAGVTSITGPFTAVPALLDLNLDNNPALASVAPIHGINLTKISFSQAGATASISIPDALNISGDCYLHFINNPGLVSVTAASLDFDGPIVIDNCSHLTTNGLSPVTINTLYQLTHCPLITSVSLSFASIQSLVLSSNSGLTSISLPSLSIADLTIDSNAMLTSISLPSLTLVPDLGLTITNNTSLASITLPSGVVMGSGGVFAQGVLNCSGNTALTHVTFPAMSFPGGGQGNGSTINLQGCALVQASVDALLAIAASNNFGTGDTVALDGGTNAGPSLTGLGSVATLTGNGCTVTTN